MLILNKFELGVCIMIQNQEAITISGFESISIMVPIHYHSNGMAMQVWDDN